DQDWDREEHEQVNDRRQAHEPLADRRRTPPIPERGHASMKCPASTRQLVSTASPTSKNFARPLCEFASSASMRAPPTVATRETVTSPMYRRSATVPRKWLSGARVGALAASCRALPSMKIFSG